MGLLKQLFLHLAPLIFCIFPGEFKGTSKAHQYKATEHRQADGERRHHLALRVLRAILITSRGTFYQYIPLLLQSYILGQKMFKCLVILWEKEVLFVSGLVGWCYQWKIVCQIVLEIYCMKWQVLWFYLQYVILNHVSQFYVV